MNPKAVRKLKVLLLKAFQIIIPRVILILCTLLLSLGCSLNTQVQHVESTEKDPVLLNFKNSSITSDNQISLTEGSLLLIYSVLSKERKTETLATVTISSSVDAARVLARFSSFTQTVKIPAGQTLGILNIQTKNDQIYQKDPEVFNLSLSVNTDDSSDIDTSNSKVKLIILDDDSPAQISLNQSSQTLVENAGTGSVTLQLDASSSLSTTVYLSAANGTATSGTDYSFTNQTITFAPGETSKSVSFNLINRSGTQSPRSFTLNVSQPTNGTLGSITTHTVNITDASQPTLSISDVTVQEGSPASFPVTLSVSSSQNVSFDWSLSMVSAVSGTDVSNGVSSGSVTIPAGQTTASITINTLHNTSGICDSDKTFRINFSNPVYATLGTTYATGTIQDIDLPTVSFTSSTSSVTEGTATSVVVNITPVCSTHSVSFQYSTTAVSATSDVDYTSASSASASIPALSSSVTLNIPTVDDSLNESSETFTINLSNPSQVTLGSPSSHTITILDNDPLPGSFSISGITGQGTPADATLDAFLVNTTNPTVSWGTATNTSSYDVTIYEDDGSTIKCGTVNTSSTSYNFSACNLSLSTYYKAKVAANNGAGTTNASNSLYRFYVNAPPLANNDGPIRIMKTTSATSFEVITASDSSTRGTVSDSDPDTSTTAGDSLSISAVTQGSAGGTVTFSSGSVSYTPSNGSFTGVETFTYTLIDSRGASSTGTVTMHVFGTYTWTGKVSSAWNANGNWCGSITNNQCNGTTGFPSSSSTTSHLAVFDGTCTAAGHNCNAAFGSATNTYSLILTSTYTGTLTQSTGTSNTLTIGAGGFTIMGGTFSGDNADITVSGSVWISGGNFNSTSAILNLNGTGVTINSSNFTHRNGTVSLACSSTSQTVSNSSVNYYHLIVGGYYCVQNFISSDVMNVAGNLTLGSPSSGSMYGGTINVTGNLTTSGIGKEGRYSTTTVKLVGSSDTTLSSPGSGAIPKLIIQKDSASNPSVKVTVSGTLNITGVLFTLSSGTLDFTTNTASLSISNYAATSSYTIGTIQVQNFTFGGYNSTINFSSGDTIQANGNVFLTCVGVCNLNNSNVNLAGNLSIAGVSGGSNLFKLIGSSDSTVTGTSGQISRLEVAKDSTTNPSVKVTFSGTTTISANSSEGSLFTSTSGNIDFITNSSTVSFGLAGTVTINPGSASFFNVSLSGTTGTYNLQSGATLKVYGTLTLGSVFGGTYPLRGGTIDVYGNLAINSYSGQGTTLIRMVGASDSTVTGSIGFVSKLSIDKDSTTNPSVKTTFNGTINIDCTTVYPGYFAVNTGAIDWTTNSATLYFGGSNNGQTTFIPGSGTYNNVTFAGSGSTQTLSSGSSLEVLGTTTFWDAQGGYVNGGTINARGNVESKNYGKYGTTVVYINGSSNSTLGGYSALSKFPTSVIIDKGSSTLTLVASSIFNYPTSQGLTVNSGTINVNGYILDAGVFLTLNGSTINKNSGTVKVNGTSIGTGSLYGGTINP